jgi:DNA-binding CsgD family transcriptional regulator
MKYAPALASIRSLCSLALPGEQLIPALLEALHRAIPSARNLFDWTDPDGNLIRYYFEGPIDAEVARHYFEEFHNKRESEAMPSFRQTVTGRAVIKSAAELDNAAFYRSALYNEIWRPQGLHSRIEAVVKNSLSEPLGSLVLYREPGDAPFTRAEESLLEAMVPYIARGLEGVAQLPQQFVTRRERRAIINLSQDGELLHTSKDAHKLLLLAHGGITPESASRLPEQSHFPTLRLLADQIRRNEGVSNRQVGFSIDNAWGRFVFEAEPLLAAVASHAAANAPTIHVSIEHQEPASIAWHRALDHSGLTIAQKEVCTLLRAGYSQPEIARALAVAPSTVADHVKKIYARLDVHSVRELCTLLSEAA